MYANPTKHNREVLHALARSRGRPALDARRMLGDLDDEARADSALLVQDQAGATAVMAADSIGPYEIRGELGRGAMAVVWRGYDPALEREVAIKEPLLPAGARRRDSARSSRSGSCARAARPRS